MLIWHAWRNTCHSASVVLSMQEALAQTPSRPITAPTDCRYRTTPNHLQTHLQLPCRSKSVTSHLTISRPSTEGIRQPQNNPQQIGNPLTDPHQYEALHHHPYMPILFTTIWWTRFFHQIAFWAGLLFGVEGPHMGITGFINSCIFQSLLGYMGLSLFKVSNTYQFCNDPVNAIVLNK